jgi:hypothetical protein
MPNSNKKDIADQAFLSTEKLCLLFDRHASFFKRRMRSGELIEKIHYFRPSGSKSLLWNLPLLKDWVVNGSDSPEHKRAIARFVAELPSHEDQLLEKIED